MHPEKNNIKKIYITQPNLPPLEKLHPYLEKIWESKILTNNGPFHEKFEKDLAEFLEVEHVNLFTNATLALVIGLYALRITGEVITTPFSFVATTNSLRWNGITPVFCDIEEDTLNIDPDKIEALITPQTTAIMPVHVYGHLCQTSKIQNIADKYGLKVIYDAAHAFGLKVCDYNLFKEGDMSILSFHGTKLFTTFEGGAIICKNERLKKRIDLLKNHGFLDEVTVIAPGINGKMNEFQAVLGILNLERVKEEIENRKRVYYRYLDCLRNIKGIKVFSDIEGVKNNYAYCPILIDKRILGISRECVYKGLKENNIFTRRYFYPLISSFPTYRSLKSASISNLPVATRISEQVLCLPIYGDLTNSEVDYVLSNLFKLIGKKV